MLPWAPVMHATWCISLAGLVVVAIAALERSASGSMRNVGPILTGGTITMLLYGASTFTICELLVSEPCRDLRLAGVERGLDPYRGPTVCAASGESRCVPLRKSGTPLSGARENFLAIGNGDDSISGWCRHAT